MLHWQDNFWIMNIDFYDYPPYTGSIYDFFGKIY